MSDFESVRDGSLVGMAEFLRGQYGVADNLYVICRNRATGVMDVSKPRTAEEVQHTKLSELRAQKRIDRAKRERLRTQRERRWALRKTKGECLQVV